MKLILALILCFIWEQETHAADYVKGVEVHGNAKLVKKNIEGHFEFADFSYPGPRDYSPYKITRVAVYDSDANPSKQTYVEGGPGEYHFREQREGNSYMKVEYWIFGLYDGDQCVKNRTRNEAEAVVAKLS